MKVKLKRKSMNLIKIILILLINIFSISSLNASSLNKIDLSIEEREFIQSHPVIKFSDVKWEPFFSIKENEHSGIFKEYYKLIEERTGLKFEFVKFKEGVNFQLVLDALKNKEIDMIDGTGKTKNREKYALFSDPLMQVSLAIVSKNNSYKSLKEIENKKIVVASGSTASEVLKDLFNPKEIIFTDGINEAISLIYNNNADVLIDNIVVLDYMIKNSIYKDVFTINAIDDYDFNIYALIRNDYTILQNILNKAISSITKKELFEINNKLLLASIQSSNKLETFSADEKKYIKEKTVKIGMLKDFYPFSYEENGSLKGYSYELIKLLSEKSSLKIEYEVDDWDNLYKKFKNKEIDLIDGISYTEDRETFTNYTRAYYEIPNVIFARKGEFENFNGFTSFKNKKVGITKDIYYTNKLKDLNLFETVEFKNTKEKIKALALGQIDVAFNTLHGAQKYINLHGYSNIRILDEIDWRIVKKEDLRIGINKDDELLSSIVKKTIDSIEFKEKQDLLLKWFTIKKEKLNKINLENKELNFLSSKKEIKYCTNPNWMPFSGIKNSELLGLNKDFIQILENSLNMPFSLVPTKSWEQSIEYLKENKCDVISVGVYDEGLKDELSFTSSYLETSIVLATKNDIPIISDISTLENKKVAVVRNKFLVNYIKLNYTNLNIVEVDTLKEAIEKTKKGEVFAVVDNLISIGYYLQQDYNNYLKISATMNKKLNLSFIVKNDNNIFFDILEKVVKNISVDEKQNIINKWFFIKYEKGFDYSLFWKVIFGIVLVVIFFIYRSYVINKLNKELNKKVKEELIKSKDKDKLIFHQNKMSSMGQMIETIAHQWRQPLSQINSSVLLIDDILFQRNINDPIIESKLLEIEKMTKYMSNTIDDFKGFIINNKEKKKFNLKEVITQSINLLKPSLDFNGIEITTVINSGECCIKGYPNELQHAILVILNNAKDEFIEKDFTNKKIVVTLESKNDLYEIFIQDNAGGIKNENIEKIFEPYFTTKLDFQGTGLGLYITKKIIEERMNGSISVENKNNGALFKISLKKGQDE